MYGHFQDSERYIADKFHEYAGWAMVPAAFLILLAILKVLRWATLPVMRYTLAS
jgi:hypothetical protein